MGKGKTKGAKTNQVHGETKSDETTTVTSNGTSQEVFENILSKEMEVAKS